MVSQTVKDLTSGTAGGVAQVLVGQPFDLVKVRMQTSPPGTYKSVLECAALVVKNEGPLAFYKGTLTPLLGIGLCVSIQFAALNSTKRYFSERNGPGKDLGYGQLFTAGVAAGLANSVIAGPVEHIRIRLQTQPNVTPKLYLGPWDCAKKLYAHNGLQGIFKGQVPTLIREGLGYGAYFCAYEALVQRHINSTGLKREEITSGYTVLYGAAAGYALWGCIYPIDVIKSKLQTDSFTASTGQKYTSSLDCFRKVWAKEGVSGFTRGLGPTLIRSPFSNGATFIGYELMMGFLTRRESDGTVASA
ncbi:mitochondrial carrier [Phaffia rhodozyma]|uniref:Mitochondrial carrier n=1 Tax=Phaffia rhodozyma TaxID=264483 RepID=A0A0F7SES4_PHARH|nr:mitochondrial carrier [Phaffia rhodozyma]